MPGWTIEELLIVGAAAAPLTGKISLTAGVLEGMAGKHPIIDKILEYRQLGKLQSTYVLALPNLINPRTGRVHTSFNQASAAESTKAINLYLSTS